MINLISLLNLMKKMIIVNFIISLFIIIAKIVKRICARNAKNVSVKKIL